MRVSYYLANALLNHSFRGTAADTQYQQPASVYLALFLSDPGRDASGQEVTGAGYTREQVVSAAPVNGVVTNELEVLFPVALDDWGIITHMAIYDAPVGGNLLFFGPWNIVKEIFEGDQFVVRPGDLDLGIQ